MSLVDRMVALNARLQSIPIRLGVPQHRGLLIRHVSLDADLLETPDDQLIEPKPYIQTVPTRLVGLELAGNITIAQDDFQITGIPRSYSLDFLQRNVSYYCIDPAIASGEILYDSKGNPASGIFCKLLSVSDRDLLTWGLILRKLRDHYQGEQTEVNW